MAFSRLLWPLLLTASFAACSGNLGGGQSTLPGTPAVGTNAQQISQPTPTASPVSASNVATVGDSLAAQALPAVMGWGGTIAFPQPSVAPAASPNAKATASPNAPASGPVFVGVTAAVVAPPDAPRFGPPNGKSRAKHTGSADITGLFYLSLLSTADVTLGEYPKIAIDVPRAIAAKYRDSTYALAIYDPQFKEKAYRLAVADRDLSSPAAAATPVAGPAPSATPSAAGTGIPNVGLSFTPPPLGSSVDAESLPPERVGFLASATTLELKANRPVVFVLYAVPPQPTPSASPTPPVAASSTPKPDASSSSAPVPSPVAS